MLTGQAAPTTLGTAAATSAFVGAPIGASERMAEQGVSLGNAGEGALNGAVGGAVGGAALHGAAGVIGPWATWQAQTLIDAGVPLTPGQTLGGIAQRAESSLTSAPLAGGFIRNEMLRSTEGLNRVAANRALTPIGEELPQGVALGHDAVDYVFDRLGQRYDDVLNRISVNAGEFAPVRSTWATNTARIVNDAQAAGVLQYLNDLIDNVNQRLAGSVPHGGRDVPGEVLKRVESSLSSESRALRRSPDVSVSQVAPFIDDLRGELRFAVQRSNPNDARELQAINRGYAVAAILRRAANSAGTQQGVASASQLARAVRAQDSSAGGSRFARGMRFCKTSQRLRRRSCARSTIAARPSDRHCSDCSDCSDCLAVGRCSAPPHPCLRRALHSRPSITRSLAPPSAAWPQALRPPATRSPGPSATIYPCMSRLG
ncbi:hypothetical protein T281_14995 [Rhodomicrobium udaipurense JA643]|uniref:Uncharacterized protein n=1 Tax=Rhodomicrobium udaipurense TaxID=1202716 RepID=A0A8I1GCC0_9HYPH|nr:hypothetical protein [Rhodomicrobium udaipurense]KAI93727.1 hypothetical protein T281_14995 [Rhodomicrobium udaipurense JA643]MBJ7542344.1 hypothetical protein [Rhodomicrobium udaipurense]